MRWMLSLCICTSLVAVPSMGAQVSEATQPHVGRTFKTINYLHRSGATRIDFDGSSLSPGASGRAKVDSKRGYLEIDAEFRGLRVARDFGPEYFTYVLWAITPQGRAQNLGELVLRGDRSELKVTTELQAFALVVTAEPYFAITHPSDVVVLENVVRSDTRGLVEEGEARSELIRRGAYSALEKPDELSAKLMVVDPKVPLELYQARNAVRLVRWMGAERHAPDTFQKAVDLLLQAENYQARKRPATKPATMMARQAVQSAEDARLITVRRIEEERQARERSEAAEREAKAKQLAERSAAEAERMRVMAEEARAKALAEIEKTKIEIAAAKTELEAIRRQSAEEMAELNAARDRAIREKEAAERATQQALSNAELANRQRAEAERDRAEMKQRLQDQLGRVLETTNTARGLILSMADVLFDTGQFTLRPLAREKLARISGILSTQPDLRLEVEGHTDSVGGEEYNQRLSEQRANAVRNYLVEQGIEHWAITSRGFGELLPKASNESAEGRQLNRRVEIVVSGGVVGPPSTESSTNR